MLTVNVHLFRNMCINADLTHVTFRNCTTASGEPPLCPDLQFVLIATRRHCCTRHFTGVWCHIRQSVSLIVLKPL